MLVARRHKKATRWCSASKRPKPRHRTSITRMDTAPCTVPGAGSRRAGTVIAPDARPARSRRAVDTAPEEMVRSGVQGDGADVEMSSGHAAGAARG